MDSGVLPDGEVDAEGDEAGVVDPGGGAVNEEIENVPVSEGVLGGAGRPVAGDVTGHTVVEIAIVEVTTTVE